MLAEVRWARKNTVRLHIRVLRMLSMAVKDPSRPVHTDSALDWIEKNESVFGDHYPGDPQVLERFLHSAARAMPLA